MIAIERLLEAVGGEDPCGPNLEYDASFTELERIAKGRAEQQIGTTVTEAEEPNWKDVAEKGGTILESTKDLRVAVHLAKALLKLRGFAGAKDGLSIIAGFVEKYWDRVHPQLDPDDDNDPTMRINVIAALSDSAAYLGWLRMAPIVEARGLGAFNLRHVDIAAGEQTPAEGETSTDQSSIDVSLAGDGVFPPAIAVSPDSMLAGLNSGEATSRVLRVENQGASDLVYQIAAQGISGPAPRTSAARSSRTPPEPFPPAGDPAHPEAHPSAEALRASAGPSPSSSCEGTPPSIARARSVSFTRPVPPPH